MAETNSNQDAVFPSNSTEVGRHKVVLRMWGAGCVSAEAGEADQREGVKAAEPLGGFPRGQVWGS